MESVSDHFRTLRDFGIVETVNTKVTRHEIPVQLSQAVHHEVSVAFHLAHARNTTQDEPPIILEPRSPLPSSPRQMTSGRLCGLRAI